MNVTLNVTFDEAFNGTEKRITVRIPGKSESDTHTVKVPAGAVDGGRVRLKGQELLAKTVVRRAICSSPLRLTRIPTSVAIRPM